MNQVLVHRLPNGMPPTRTRPGSVPNQKPAAFVPIIFKTNGVFMQVSRLTRDANARHTVRRDRDFARIETSFVSQSSFGVGHVLVAILALAFFAFLFR